MMATEEKTCAWGTCDGEATEEVEYPDGKTLHVCAECAEVARAEVAHLRREATANPTLPITITYEPADVPVSDDRETVRGARVSVPGATGTVIPREGDAPDC